MRVSTQAVLICRHLVFLLVRRSSLWSVQEQQACHPRLWGRSWSTSHKLENGKLKANIPTCFTCKVFILVIPPTMQKLQTKKHERFTCWIVCSWSSPHDAELILDFQFQWSEQSVGSNPVRKKHPEEMASGNQTTASASQWHCPWSVSRKVWLFHLYVPERRKGLTIQRRQHDLPDEKGTLHFPPNPNIPAAVPTKTRRQMAVQVSTDQIPKYRRVCTGSWQLPSSPVLEGSPKKRLTPVKTWIWSSWPESGMKVGFGVPGQNQGWKWCWGDHQVSKGTSSEVEVEGGAWASVKES